MSVFRVFFLCLVPTTASWVIIAALVQLTFKLILRLIEVASVLCWCPAETARFEAQIATHFLKVLILVTQEVSNEKVHFIAEIVVKLLRRTVII